MKKINTKELFEAYNLLESFNQEDMYDLDLGELFEGNPQEALDTLRLSGLQNIDFLTSDIPMQKGLQRKYKFNGKRFESVK